MAALASGCSSSTGDDSASKNARPHSVSAGITASATPTTRASDSAPGKTLPAGVEKVARAFTVAYAQHDATNGGDRSYADAGARAAKLASGELVDVLAQKRPGQEAPWAELRSEQARQTAKITSAVVPDGAPAATPSSALVRVAYTLTTTPKSGPARHSSEQLALRLEHTADGWRVTALPVG
ncbi:hypothetical protein [Streptomyces sp. YIM 121038]|uniref:hypothetical protein n=1 Tax=Streptomyces sp. YIM 121038 TaxID=2136401 RepID=UPI002016BEF8|nr:hypothetical protein [Streptomyces sp. YIM 121038]